MDPTNSERTSNDPLALDAETMRRLGHRAVDMLVDRIAGLDDEPAWSGATRADMERRLREPAPASAEPPDALLKRLKDDVLDVAGRVDHPRFFAFVPSCPTWPGVLADLLVHGYNTFQGTWLESAGPSEVEVVVLDWFKEWIGYPDAADGILVSGGSAANLTALVCARDARLGGHDPDAVIYLSDQVHSSVARAARILGFRPDQLRTLPTDDVHRLQPDALRGAVDDDARAGRTPFLVVANAGATSTGAVDPLSGLASAAAERDVWLHVDAAYGGYAVLTERGRALLGGLERADSITLDPHKWLYQPFEAGCLLVRQGGLLRDAFHVMPDYMQDTATERGEVNFADRGIQLTRTARAIKIWLSLQFFGVDAFREAIDRCLDLAERAQRRVEASAELELLSPARLGIVCFRRRIPSADEEEHERVNAELVDGLTRSGLGMISSTRVDGRYALRLCILNHRSGPADVDRVLDWLATASV